MAIAEEQLEAICRIPTSLKNQSLSRAVKTSGFGEFREAITERELAAYLASHPQFINDWEGYSLDKRTTSGWYLVMRGDRWTVGFLGDARPDEWFHSAAEACAAFMLRDIDRVHCSMSFRRRRWPAP